MLAGLFGALGMRLAFLFGFVVWWDVKRNFGVFLFFLLENA